MAFDLRATSWIPFLHRSGTVRWGRITDLAAEEVTDHVVGIASPRADFDGAIQEFLIGVLTAAFLPHDDAWDELRESPPSVEALQSAIDALPDAFNLDGDGPRFLQDMAKGDFEDIEPTSISQLLIEAPGTNTIKLNRDLFVKRNEDMVLGRAAAAMTLLTMQTYAPSGGSGHRTSVRGGGPLTTLIDPRVDSSGNPTAHEQPLWHKLWANVETVEEMLARMPSSERSENPKFQEIFPWLVATRTSNPKSGGHSTSPGDVHALQAYFGMPRRIRLDFDGPGKCDLTGMEDEHTVRSFRMLNWGTDYVAWQHPLSPYYRQKLDTEWLPVHGQPTGIGWRDWASLTVSGPAETLRRPATTVSRYMARIPDRARRAIRLDAFGFDMDHMKARGWVQASMPVYVSDEARQRLIYATASQLAEATNEVRFALSEAVKEALYKRAEDAKGDYSAIAQQLYESTSNTFYSTMEEIAQADSTDAASDQALAIRRDYLGIVRKSSEQIFDAWVPVAGLSGEQMRRRVIARHNLSGKLKGYTKTGAKLFAALGLEIPDSVKKKGTSRKKERTEK